MTALNLIVQTGAAHLLMDKAAYDGSGRLVNLASKTLVNDQLSLALGFCGMFSTVQAGAALDAVCSGDTEPEQVIEKLPGVASALRKRAAIERPECEASGDNECGMAVIYWSKREGAARGVFLTTAPGGPPRYQPLRLALYTSPDVDLARAVGRPLDGSNLDSFDADRDGLALLEAQRRTPWADGRYYLGGAAELTTVTAQGVSQRGAERVAGGSGGGGD